MVTRSELAAQRNAGIAGDAILSNTIAAQASTITAQNGAIDEAHAAIVTATEAVADIAVAADLAAAQALAAGISGALSDAQTLIETVRPDLISA